MIAALCRFYGVGPAQLRDATMEELAALTRWMEQSLEARADASR